MAHLKKLLPLFLLLTTATASLAQMVDKHLWEFATPGGGGYPNDSINDHEAFVNAAAFFQARNGYGTLILEGGEYIIGAQQLRDGNDPPEALGWNTLRYPLSDPSDTNHTSCRSMVAYQDCFVLNGCSDFTIQGGQNTKIRYRDCLYYGTFLRNALTGEVTSGAGRVDTLLGQVAVSRCVICDDTLRKPIWLDIDLLHAAVGIMFTFRHCDAITMRDVELDGNIDAAILGGTVFWDGMQTDYDGVMIWESSQSLIENVHAHHFGRDGLLVSGNYNDTIPFQDVYPGLFVEPDPDSSGTVIFNNTIRDSRFEWNGRQGISWTACSGLHLIDCDLNYTAAGRMRSSPGAGLDIEGGGGPMRVRYGVFDDCRFLHNRGAGVHADSGPCWGQQDFRFNNCVFKAGEDADAMWANSRGMKFFDCQIYGRVASLFEQAEDLPNDTSFNLLFRRTDFHEEDDLWAYLFPGSGSCSGGPHKLDLVAPAGHTACVNFDSCAFYTNCRGLVRMVGRDIAQTNFPYCPDCEHCGGPLASTCPQGSCATQGIYQGTDTSQDARYIRATNCSFKNTGRLRCDTLTGLIAVDLTTLVNFRIDVPDAVRNSVTAFDTYVTAFGAADNWGIPTCADGGFCTDVDTTYTTYESFPPCRPLYHWPDSIVRWSYCQPDSGNIATNPCGNYILTKTATPTETQPDSTVTFTIAVCNNTVYATPVVLSDQLPPSFTVTGASIWLGMDTTLWSTANTSLTLNNGECAEFTITGYFTAFGEFTNTVTLDTDTAQAGAELTDSATVSVVSACEAEIIIPDSSLASVVGTVFSNTTVNIQGLFVVDDDVLFQSAQVFMEAGAEIVVLPGFTLDIISSSVESCPDVMWKGITALGGSLVRMRGSFVDDAENVVTALDGSTLVLRDNQFHNNRTTIHVPVVEGVPWNDVAIYALGNTFYSQGAMPQPYPGQATAVGAVGFAAFDVNYMVLDLTDGNNIIHDMSNGIVAHRSDVRVLDCRMLNIKPDGAYTYVGNGAGIYAYGGKGWNMLEQQGYGMGYTPSFENCRWGIYTEYMHVYSTDNNMVDMGTAYRIDRSGNCYVDILNNKASTRYHGIELRVNDGAMHILVEGNEITFGNSTCDFCRGYSGILVHEGNIPSDDSRIMHNTIHFLPMTNSRLGISLTAADDWLVAENEVIMASNADNLTGIHLAGCNRPEVSCNTVMGSATSFPLDAQSAIRNVQGNDPLISCNVVDLTANGILFNGVAPNTDVRGNRFNRHRWGLHLDGTAIIDVQDRKGNLWYQQPAAGGLGAWYEVSDAQSVLSAFFVTPATIDGGSTYPPSWSPQDWFQPTFGANYDCADDGGGDYCGQFKQRGKEQLTELDVKVASDSLENDPYTAETKWMLHGRLYMKLDKNPDLLDSLQVMDDLYEDLQGSTTAVFKQVDEEQLHLYGLDSTVIVQLQVNRLQIDSLQALLKAGLEQLLDSTLSSAQQASILASINGHRESIGDLTAWSTTTLAAATATRDSVADDAQALNTSVLTSTVIEANEKTVNSIYLTVIGKDVDMFTADQVTTLFDIANQCPMLGGNAVFKARSLYWLIDDTQDFDDATICLPHGIVVKRMAEITATAVYVLPNPATDEATLILSDHVNAPNVFVLFDAIGAEVMRCSIPADMPRFAFSTASLAPALYHYQVRGPSGLIGVGKLTIVR